MVEPTESESKAELDRFCDAMIHIREEIRAVEEGRQPRDNNVLTRSPHPIHQLLVEKWDRPYSREQAAYPVADLRKKKFWPSVGRVDDTYGDRNLVSLHVILLRIGADSLFSDAVRPARVRSARVRPSRSTNRASCRIPPRGAQAEREGEGQAPPY